MNTINGGARRHKLRDDVRYVYAERIGSVCLFCRHTSMPTTARRRDAATYVVEKSTMGRASNVAVSDNNMIIIPLGRSHIPHWACLGTRCLFHRGRQAMDTCLRYRHATKDHITRRPVLRMHASPRALLVGGGGVQLVHACRVPSWCI